MLLDYRGRRVLLLQGPAGPFFRRVANDLRAVSASVTKINFNGGDWLFFPGPEARSFRGSAEDWPEYLASVLQQERITDLIVFGDMRPLHRTAIEIARSKGVAVGVFEEGYLRPDYVTFEADGVNGNSTILKDSELYRGMPTPAQPTPIAVGNTFVACASWSMLYSLATTLLWAFFPRYRHHRPINFAYHVLVQLRGLVRKLVFAVAERGALERLVDAHAGRYFVVPLQVHCDAQLLHSPYEDVTSFIEQVTASFAASAPTQAILVFKHHPMDRAYREYGRFVRALARRHGLTNRILYVHDVHLPTLLRHARGTVVINSTVGLSSIHHGTPVKVMGTAIYDMPGLTHRGSLADFWRRPDRVDEEIYRGFRAWLLRHNQINGSVWCKLWGPARHVSLYWDSGFECFDSKQSAPALQDRTLQSLPSCANPAIRS